jgi:hypothetical protein
MWMDPQEATTGIIALIPAGRLPLEHFEARPSISITSMTPWRPAPPMAARSK